MSSLGPFLFEVTLVLAAARALGLLARRMGQPAVVAEMIAGVLLGPSVLGRISPRAWEAIFPASSTHVLGLVSQLGLFLFAFLVGLELDVRFLQGRAPKTAAAVGAAAAVVPALLAVPLALHLHAREAPAAGLAPFVLFVVAAMSVTAFPVLARILVERRLLRTRVGTLAIASAAAVDVAAACVLALLVTMVRRGHSPGALVTAAVSFGFAAGMIFVVRPLLGRFVPRATAGGVGQGAVAVILVLLLTASLAMELAGAGGIFGAFMFGCALPKEGGFARQIAEKLEDLVLVFFLPLFFAYSGLRTELGTIGDGDALGTWAIIVAVAFAGKLGAGALSARLSGLPWSEAGAIGALLNTRGVVEIVVLNVGLDLHLVSPRLFSMMIAMALVTTLATAPLLDLFYPRERALRDALAAAPPEVERGFCALVCVQDLSDGPRLVAVAGAIGGGRPGCLHVMHVRPYDDRASRVLAAQQQEEEEAKLARIESSIEGMEVRSTSFASQRPARDVCDLASVKDADVIVLGTRARGLVRDVLDHASCPVAVLDGREPDPPSGRVLVLRGGRATVAERLARGLGLELAALDEAGVRGAPATDLLVVEAEGEPSDAPRSAASTLVVRAPRGWARSEQRPTPALEEA